MTIISPATDGTAAKRSDLLVKILAVAVAYAVTGEAGLQLAIPPGYATAVWPPSGIALAAVLVWGWRVWPGVVLGSFAVNLWTGLDTSSLTAALSGLFIPAVIGSAAGAQALTGYWLVHRYGRFPNTLVTPDEIGRLLALGGVASCLVNCTISVTTLTLLGRIPLAAAPYNWATWWAGDAIGVFLLTPVILVAAFSGRRERRRRALPVALVLTLAFAVTIVTVANTLSFERRELAHRFDELGEAISREIKDVVRSQLQLVVALEARLYGSDGINLNNFHQFSARMLQRTGSPVVLEWIPRVTPDDREAFEARLRRELGADFTIHEDARGGNVRSNPPLSDRFPIVYVEPPEGNLKAVGFDIGKDAVRRAALMQARDSGAIAVTALVKLVQDGSSAVLAMAPVYELAAPARTTEQRRNAFTGVALGVIRLAPLVAEALRGVDTSEFSYWLRDETDFDAPTTLIANDKGEPTPFRFHERGLFGTDQALAGLYPIKVGGRIWALRTAPNTTYFGRRTTNDAWLVLFAGLVFTSVVSAFALVIIGREHELRVQVSERTVALTLSEERYRDIFANSPQPMWVYDTVTLRFIDVNRAAIDHYGYARDEFLAMTLADIRPPTDVAVLQEGLNGGKTATRSGEFRHLAKGGRLLLVQLWSRPLPGTDGALRVALIVDVTSRKQAEAKLIDQMRQTRHHYENLRALSDIAALPGTDAGPLLDLALELGSRHLGLPVGVVGQITDSTFTVRHHFDGAGLGVEDGQQFDVADTYCAVVQTVGDVVAIPHVATSPHAGYPCYRSSGLESYIGAPVVVRGGGFGTVSFASPARADRMFDAGDIEFMRLLARWIGVVIERDLGAHERHAAMIAAEVQRRRTDLILRSADGGIFGIDHDARLTFANPAACRLLGYEVAADMIGRSTTDVGVQPVDEDSSSDGGDLLAATLADGEIRRSDSAVFRRADGTSFPVEFSVTPMVENGSITGAVVEFRDISERRAAERGLAAAAAKIERQAQALVRINAELEQFAYVASHDMRQPLRTVTGYLGLIKRELGPACSEDLKDFIGTALDGAKRMDRLIVDLLQFSRTGRTAGPMVPVSLVAVMQDCLRDFEAEIEDGTAEIVVAEDLPTVTGSQSELLRLFQNLIGNALKYRAPDRRPRIEVGCERTVTDNGAEVILWVRDNGIGIDMQHRERVFEIFQRLVSQEQYDGTGIGLAICKKIVTGHGGRIWLESVPGEGSTFYVAFPSASASS